MISANIKGSYSGNPRYIALREILEQFREALESAVVERAAHHSPQQSWKIINGKTTNTLQRD